MVDDVSRSQERLLDAIAIEEIANTVSRPTARMHLEALAKKLRKESEALARIDGKSITESKLESDDAIMDVEDETKVDIPNRSPIAGAGQQQREDSSTILSLPIEPMIIKPPPPIVMTQTTTPIVKYVSVTTFSFDAGGYNAPFVTVYVPLPNVGTIDRTNITCTFNTSSFDLIVNNLCNKSYRLFQDNLEKDIDPSKCKYIIKSEKIILKLAKVKQPGDYGGYDYWTKLSDKKQREKSTKMKDDPSSSIMDMMKQMYDDGDDNMKKIIGETMMKQQRGEINKDDPMKGLE